MKHDNRIHRKTLIVSIVLIAFAIVFMAPIIWMFNISLLKRADVFKVPLVWFPFPLQWANYWKAMTSTPFFQYFANTLFISVLSIVGEILSCSLVAFSFSRLRWKGRDALFLVVLATMMLPKSMTMIPVFVIFSHLHLINTYVPLVLPHFFGFPFYIFLMRQFFIGMPKSMDEAARIDGCGVLTIYARIIMPLSKPVIGIVAIQVFRDVWNDFINPLLYLNDIKKWTLTLWLQSFQQDFTVDWTQLMSASVITTVPVLLLFFMAQKYFMQDIVFTGVKE
ncbi:carbohydrate ABC transporter permease [uncultured Sphaerochaeta sp.]|uniref:carbohydrate ABC transporter permease n=1 Tax=uncultured Sphaerochaeta sp. TaxID=886478 RepID=UPI002A0A1E87|nr:carbohydrate ABC transporter permease [uncultured Sphaerochaeta sp.]